MHATKESKFLSTYAKLNKSPSVLASALLGLSVADAVSTSYLKENNGIISSPVTREELSSCHTGDCGDLAAMTLACAETVFSDDWMEGDRIFKNMLFLLKQKSSSLDAMASADHALYNALLKFSMDCPPQLCGSFDLNTQEPFVLARMIPFSIRLAADYRLCVGKRCSFVHEYAGLTHQNPKSMITCGFFSEIIKSLIFIEDIPSAIKDAYIFLHYYYKEDTSLRRYLKEFSFLLNPEVFAGTDRHTFISSVKNDFPLLQVFKIALYSLLNSSSYEECVCMALQFGLCPNTSSAISGALGGLVYGMDGICPEWLSGLNNRSLIESVCSSCIACGAPVDTDTLPVQGFAV